MVLPSDHTIHMHCLQKNPKSVKELWSALTFRHLSSASLRHGLSIREAREPWYRRDFGITQSLDQHLLAQGSRAGQQPFPTSVSSSLWAKGQLASLPSVTSPLWHGPVTLRWWNTQPVNLRLWKTQLWQLPQAQGSLCKTSILQAVHQLLNLIANGDTAPGPMHL